MNKPSKEHRRFFYHYYRQYGKMSFHFSNEKCMIVDNVNCQVPCETKWNDRSQPNLIMRGWAKGYKIDKNNTVTIY